LNVVYTCTEDIEENGKILAYEINPDGSLLQIGEVDAGGTSTCYLTIDREQRNLIAVNYWDSSLVVIPLSKSTGEFTGPIHSVYDPRQGKAMMAAAKKHGGVNHSNNDESTIAQRQVDPHSHALVLDPFEGCVAYVPDLGKDLVREFWYDKESGRIGCEINTLPSGLSTGKPDGPRYFEFHPKFNVAYVVNELSSTVAVFSIDRELLAEIARAAKLKQPMDKFKGRSTLKLIQSIKTVPSAFPTKLNTCGRICVHQSGRFVIVSNRGHESITIFRVKQSHGNSGKARRGTLAQVGFFHTRGETPRHFQFDHSGQFLIVANQDSDTIAVFSFNLTSGEIKYTGNEYRVPSPNFICSCPVIDRDGDDDIEQKDKVGSFHFTSVGGEDNASTIPTSVEIAHTKEDITTSANLQSELEIARKEIAELRKQISSMSALSS
jgi:6-phosphogluconolactonase (cycloisomerase 2 family)